MQGIAGVLTLSLFRRIFRKLFIMTVQRRFPSRLTPQVAIHRATGTGSNANDESLSGRDSKLFPLSFGGLRKCRNFFIAKNDALQGQVYCLFS